jgi:single-strand DNA-binding protein
MNGIEAAFIARVGTEPELKTSAAGKPWAAFNAAVGSGDDVQWVRVAVFGDLAEGLAGHVLKGDRLYCEGRLKLNEWTDREGKSRTGLSVAAWKIEKLGQIGRNKPAKRKAPPEGDHPIPPAVGRQSDRGAAAGAERDWQRSLADADIPF